MDDLQRWYRSRVLTRRFLFAGLAGALLVSACSKPEPPRLEPKEVRVTAVGPAGFDILVRIEATNPNRVTLSAQSFTGKARLDGKWDLGSVTITKPVVLPPNAATMIDVPMTLPWTDVKALAALATATAPVPYVIDGTAAIGGETLSVSLPYSISGTLTREQVVGAALKALPVIPGLTAPVQQR